MFRNLFLFLCSFMFFSVATAQQAKVAKVYGKNIPKEITFLKINHVIDNQISDHGDSYWVPLEGNTDFTVEIPIEQMASARLEINNGSIDIVLSPGDSLVLDFANNSLVFKGIGAEKNTFLFQAMLRGLSDRAYYQESNRCELPPAELLQSVTDFKQKRLDFLKSYNDSLNLDEQFVKYFTVETQVIFEQLIQEYPSRYSYVHDIPEDSIELSSDYQAINQLQNFLDDDKVISAAYLRTVRNNLFDKAISTIRNNPGSDFTTTRHALLFDSLTGRTREYVVAHDICTNLSHEDYDTLAINKFNEMALEDLPKRTVAAAIAKYQEKQSLLGQPIHQEFMNTLLKDDKGVTMKFGEMMEKYKGKVVYLDFWGMGCGPCRAAMPHAKKMKENLSGEPIAFVYLSVEWILDNNWKNIYKATLTNENHYFIVDGFNCRLLKFMGINSIPRYMIFDKEGKLIDFNAPRPPRYEETLGKDGQTIISVSQEASKMPIDMDNTILESYLERQLRVLAGL